MKQNKFKNTVLNTILVLKFIGTKQETIVVN